MRARFFRRASRTMINNMVKPKKTRKFNRYETALMAGVGSGLVGLGVGAYKGIKHSIGLQNFNPQLQDISKHYKKKGGK